MQALGMTLADLFVQPRERRNGHKRIVATYDYINLQGEVVHQTVRFADKTFKQRRPDPVEPGAWVWNLKGVQTVLYRLPDVVAGVHAGQTIFLVEGEKDCENLRPLGLIVTTNPLGADKWRPHYNQWLQGAAVVLLADNDAAGRAHVAHVAQSLSGTATSIKVVVLPGLPDKGDVSDWLIGGGTRAELERIVDVTPLWTPTAGHAPGPEPPDPYSCPELSASARVDEDAAASASRFLDDYIAHSKTWAPRAYEGFHEAAGLFALATTAARRVKIQLGPRGVYTSLYLALCARTSLYTKTTVADIGIELMRAAGLQALLADDDATPQAFLRALTLHVPPDYPELPPDEQEALRQRLAFAGQKGWFYEEWGQHLHAMMQKEGVMAAFRGILRRLDDHKDEYTTSSIARGRETLKKPYVTLLANVTPADLAAHLRPQSPLWRDGYLARFVFVTPGTAPATTTPFPEGAMTIPPALITALASWHKRLGIPRVVLEPIKDAKDKATGRFQPSFLYPHRETTYTLSPDVRAAFYRYDEAMHTLMRQSQTEDLDGSYSRFPVKALRIAGLLASLQDDGDQYTIWPAQWYRGQQIAERWRHDLHVLRAQLDEAEQPTRESKGEQRVLDVLRTHGSLTMRDINRWTKLAHTDIARHLEGLQRAGVVHASHSGRTTRYTYVLREEADDD
jgi:DNA-binding transcriptional ArsR family regulator